jgi:hypothetical protein
MQTSAGKCDTKRISGLEVVEIEEDCLHEVQYNGMCVNCGKDMNE